MEVLFWTSMYALAAVMFYLFVLWAEDFDFVYYSFGTTIPIALVSIFWPFGVILLITCSPFYGVFKLYVYIKTRKKVE